MPPKPRILLLTGVSGSGKSTIGKLLSQKTGSPFFDGDDFHPAANIEKMASGIPLTDQDRWPWLESLKEKISARISSRKNAIFACSALRRIHRDFLTENNPEIEIIYLKGNRKLLFERLHLRTGHFMKKEMLSSQLAALEEPQNALTIDISQSPEEIANLILTETGFD